MTYTELVTAIQDFAENTFETADVNNFIQLAEQKIYNSVNLPSLRKNVTGSLTSGNQYLSCPTDFLAPFSLAVISAAGAYTYLLNKDVNFIREAYPTPSVTGTPAHYAIFGPQSTDVKELSLLVGPTPDATYTVELHYFAYPTSIVTAGQTWLGDNFDSALLNGALWEAGRFMKSEADTMAVYKSAYDEAIGLLKNLSEGKMRQDAYRSGQARTKPF